MLVSNIDDGEGNASHYIYKALHKLLVDTK